MGLGRLLGKWKVKQRTDGVWYVVHKGLNVWNGPWSSKEEAEAVFKRTQVLADSWEEVTDGRAASFYDLIPHVDHDVVCVSSRGFGDSPANVAVECETCDVVLMDYDAPNTSQELT